MIVQIAIWTGQHSVNFQTFARMVAIWSDDAEYWSAQPMSRLYAEAIGERCGPTKPAPFRV